MLKCDSFQTQSDIKEYYIHSYLSTKCYSDYYYKWLSVSIIPWFIFYAVLLPLVAAIFMIINRQNIYAKDIIVYVGFLVNGYKGENNYWEFLFLLRKIALNLVVIFLDRSVAPQIFMIILLICLILQYKNQPFLTKQLNNYEFYGIFCCCWVLMFSLFSEAAENKFIQMFCISLMFIPNCIFILMVGKILFFMKLNEMMRGKENKFVLTKFNKFLKSNVLLNNS